MKPNVDSVACFFLAVIWTAALSLGADQAGGISDDTTPFTYTLWKHKFDRVGRTSFTLEVKPKRTESEVTAMCELRDGQDIIGRFPLGNVNAQEAGAPVRFRVACLANAYIDHSRIRVEIQEKGTLKHVGSLQIYLRDAVPEPANPKDRKP